MKKLTNPKAGKAPRLCRHIGDPASISQKKPGANRKASTVSAPITNHLNKILLALGYDDTLVKMLGRRYDC